jgi:hypothetical protein
MQTVRILYDIDGWAYHRRAQALLAYAPSDLSISAAPVGALDPHQPSGAAPSQALGEPLADLYFLLVKPALKPLRAALASRGVHRPIITAYSRGTRFGNAALVELHQLSDAVVTNNRFAWEALRYFPNACRIDNGVDLDTFRVKVPLIERRSKVLWMGSTYHRRIKGYDEFIVPLAAALDRLGIAHDFRCVDSWSSNLASTDEMVRWYNQGTIYVSASVSEGTPNPALEASACGCVVVGTPVGNLPDLIEDRVSGVLVPRDVEALLEGIVYAQANYARLAQRSLERIRAFGWKERSQAYYELFRQVLNRPAARRGPQVDLSNEVTVFVSTVGGPSFADCRRHLDAQDVSFCFEIIKDVAPMSAAFQRMIDRCRTRYFVQVDEDMLLFPHAIRFLYDLMSVAGEDVAVVAARLYDLHLGQPIRGVKMFRHEIARRYPLEDVESCEKAQNDQFARDGFVVLKTPIENSPHRAGDVLGIHGSHYTPQSVYERYFTLQRRLRRRPALRSSFMRYEHGFLDRFLAVPSEFNFFALMGAVAGSLAPLDGPGAEKDFRSYASLPGLAGLKAAFRDLSIGSTTGEGS